MEAALRRPESLLCDFGGPVGERLHAVIDQWLLVAPDANPAMLEMFADRDVRPCRNLVPWAGEFAGKYLTSGVQILRATGDVRLRTTLVGFVAHLIRLQCEDGYLGPWPRGHHLTNTAPNVMGDGPTWDAWGHYHAMLGLMLWADETGDHEAMAAACRIGDLLCALYLGEPDVRLVDTGEADKNLAPAHALAMLHARTREARYLSLAQQIVDEFAAQGADGPLAGDWYRMALAGCAFYETHMPRWESLHPIMALAELHWLTDDGDARRAFEHLWWSIWHNDVHNNGGFSSGERATGNPFDPGAIETCCTIAWMAMSVEMLKLTGDPRVADELEASTLNSVLGMHAASGRWATYNTPSDGARFAAAHQIVFQARAGSPELNCCSVNAPRGLGLLSAWAVMVGGNGVTLNYYGPSTFTVSLGDGVDLALVQETDYPAGGAVRIAVSVSQTADFALRLRIPAWSGRTTCSVNGEAVAGVDAGSYLTLARAWASGDVVELELDIGIRRWEGQRECEGLTSLYRGPVLLAFDPRYNRAISREGGLAAPDAGVGEKPWDVTGREVAVPAIAAGSIGEVPAVWHDWLPPMLLFDAETVNGDPLRLCGFASAGQTGTIYRSWLKVIG